MPPATETRATLDDLYAVEGKAELIGGRIVQLMGGAINRARVAFEICRQPATIMPRPPGAARRPRRAELSPSPRLSSGRESFCARRLLLPGPVPSNPLRFVDGAPTFAVEVRSEHDYGPAAERDMAAKRLDYFEAGTLVVWDVDTVAEVIHEYRRDQPDQPTTFARGEVAEAEPAVAGWQLAVDTVFG